RERASCVDQRSRKQGIQLAGSGVGAILGQSSTLEENVGEILIAGTKITAVHDDRGVLRSFALNYVVGNSSNGSGANGNELKGVRIGSENRRGGRSRSHGFTRVCDTNVDGYRS